MVGSYTPRRAARSNDLHRGVTEDRYCRHMGSGKGRRGSGSPSALRLATAHSPRRTQQSKAEKGWPARVKVLASSTLGDAASREEGACAL